MTVAMPQRKLQDLPKEMEDFRELAMICNILSEPVLPINHSSFGVFYIAVPEPGERYALTSVTWQNMYMDKGDSDFRFTSGYRKGQDPARDNRIKMVQGALQIAQDLCQQMNSSNGPADDSETSPFWGKFVCESEKGPTEGELVKAELRLRNYFLRVMSVADAEWAKGGRHDMMDSRFKIAARHLGIKDRAWLLDYVPNVKCPACMEPIIEGAKVCKHCHTILDQGAFHAEEPKKKPGRPPKVHTVEQGG